jgi:hypothetical protein
VTIRDSVNQPLLKNKTMNKNIIIYGLIAGIVVSIPMLFTANSTINSAGSVDFDTGMVIGYASMLLAFSLVFVGIRNYRNNYNNGEISFGKAFKIGMMIVLIATTLYVLAWLIDYYYFIPDFAEKYAAHTIERLKASGVSQVEIAKQTKEMADFATMYKNPFFNAMITYSEILPVGLVVTLISAFILKTKSIIK